MKNGPCQSVKNPMEIQQLTSIYYIDHDWLLTMTIFLYKTSPSCKVKDMTNKREQRTEWRTTYTIYLGYIKKKTQRQVSLSSLQHKGNEHLLKVSTDLKCIEFKTLHIKVTLVKIQMY